MPISPQKQRELVFLLVYSDDFHPGDEAEMTQLLMHELAVTKKVMRIAHEEKVKIQEKINLIDERIAEHSKAYDFDRIPRIERNILRLSIYELLFSETVPPKVAIAEAIRLSRKFATPEAATFVNAILDAIYQLQLTQGCPNDSAVSV
ncbi:MAG: transcription antitermination factor NusB [Rhabdochlamydiaceae bacterium]|nr:transcription antitermination factor NusB [Rhabdochlamydiaceae bacterium]